MEKIEHKHKPEIHTEQLLDAISRVQWEEMEEIEYNGTNFLLFFCDETSESDNHAEAVFHASQIADFDIYILSSLSLEEKKRRLFHEMLEANLRKQDFDEDEAHEIALEEEERVFGKRVQ